MSWSRFTSVGLYLLLFLAPVGSPAGAQLPPDMRWWSYETEHFRVHYHEGLEPLARRAGDRAETAYALLSEAFVDPPGGRIDLVVSDNVDFANGYATPLPTNRIVVFAHPPVDEPSLSFFDDWLQLVITHELTHIFHLDYARGVWRPLRRVFGRTAFFFPQVYSPGWTVEGLAVFYESQLTRAGRIRGTHFEMMLRTAVLQDAFFSIDRATGVRASWPGGHTRYIYGSLFMAHLADRHDTDRVAAFVREVGGQILPYRLNTAARRAFGVTFTRAWGEWEESLRERYGGLADSLRAAGLTEPEVLTREGELALHPRFAPDGERIAFVSRTGREEPSTRVIHPDGRQQVLAPRSTLGPVSWYGGADALLTAQLEFRDRYRILSDLHRITTDRGTEPLTHGARIQEPDLHPDGRRAAAIASAAGTNIPVIVELETGRIRPLAQPSLDTHWAAPRFSPAGDRIAVARWETGGFFNVVVLDSVGTLLHELTRDRAVNTSPAWSPDGRYLLFSSDRTGITNLYAHDLDSGELLQVTNVLTGAFQPDVSPDGRWIAFSYYWGDGYHIARIPYDPVSWRAAPPVRAAVEAPGAAVVASGTAEGPARPYSPWASLAPAAWLPEIDPSSGLGIGLGAETGGTDLIGRHAWSARGRIYPAEWRFDGGAFYRYRGWGDPVLDMAATRHWSVVDDARRGLTSAGDTLTSAWLARQQRISVSLQHQRPRWRNSSWIGAGGDILWRENVWQNPEFDIHFPFTPVPPDVGALLFAGHSTARGYALSISPEEGFLLSGTTEARRYTRPRGEAEEAAGYLRMTGRIHAFQPFDPGGFARQVAALRLTAGLETGEIGPGFSLGGVSSTVLPFPAGLTLPGVGPRTFPVRGYDAGVQRGNRVVSGTAEYRVPVRLVERGVGLLPIFTDRVWGNVFVDAGAAWCVDVCEQRRFVDEPRGPRPIVSAGAEAALGFVFGYGLDLTLRGGVAVPLSTVADAAGPGVRPPVSFYLVSGRSF